MALGRTFGRSAAADVYMSETAVGIDMCIVFCNDIGSPSPHSRTSARTRGAVDAGGRRRCAGRIALQSGWNPGIPRSERRSSRRSRANRRALCIRRTLRLIACIFPDSHANALASLHWPQIQLTAAPSFPEMTPINAARKVSSWPLAALGGRILLSR